MQKPTFRPDIPVHADAGDFLDRITARLPEEQQSREDWLKYCRRMQEKYPVITQEHRNQKTYVSSYVFPELLARSCGEESVIVTGNGVAYTSTFQALPVRKGMRVFANEACASMGYGLPAAIGAAFAFGGRPVYCITGDGSLQMNLQELQTMKNYQLPLKLFVYNNGGYLSIKLTQQAFFNGHFVGSESGSGIVLPDLEKLAAAYELPFFRIRNNTEAAAKLPEIIASAGPAVIEVMLDPFETLSPKAASGKLEDGTMISAPLEDLAPFLPREEFLENMIIKPVDDTF